MSPRNNLSLYLFSRNAFQSIYLNMRGYEDDRSVSSFDIELNFDARIYHGSLIVKAKIQQISALSMVAHDALSNPISTGE